MGDSVLTLAQALDTFDRWSEDPRVEFTAEPRGLESVFRQTAAQSESKSATKFLMDAFLASFAEAERATLVTFDSAFAGIARRRRAPHVLLRERHH
ncbi:MAG TPA: hypothetical protein VH639_11030 [Bryobacteraceae bacterium]|jgi:predicted nucleic acid-binding protein